MGDETKMIMALIAINELTSDAKGMQQALYRYTELEETLEGVKTLEKYKRQARSILKWMIGGGKPVTPALLVKYGWTEQPVILRDPVKLFGITLWHNEETLENRYSYTRQLITIYTEPIMEGRKETGEFMTWIRLSGGSTMLYPEMTMTDLFNLEAFCRMQASEPQYVPPKNINPIKRPERKEQTPFSVVKKDKPAKGHQPTDKLDTNNPPSGNGKSE